MSGALYVSPRAQVRGTRDVTLVDLLDRLLAGGVVVRGQITLAAADIDLVDLDVGLLVAAVDTLAAG